MRFFFYGTLMAGSRNPVARALHAKLRALGPATTRGSLFAIPDPQGWFPAMLPGEEVVHGALYEALADFDAEDIARIDAYETCDPAHPETSLYRRGHLDITTADGTCHAVQAYHFIQPLPAGAIPIAGGNFTAWQAERGLRAYHEEG